jgi:hypothetical protein
MTKDQKEALERIKAIGASAFYEGHKSDSYSTEDMSLVFTYLEDIQDRLRIVEDDLVEMKEYMETSAVYGNDPLTGMINSSLELIKNGL